MSDLVGNHEDRFSYDAAQMETIEFRTVRMRYGLNALDKRQIQGKLDSRNRRGWARKPIPTKITYRSKAGNIVPHVW